jgi:hypothetical protein
MSINSLSLPEDIPWKRVAISRDMHVARGSDELPFRWRSSLAAYMYEPEPDPTQLDINDITTFVKISASITGFQPDGPEIISAIGGAAYSSSVIERFRETTGKYYPALAAMLQVVVLPEGIDCGLEDYPYFVDVEPKKRELMELVTETGEVLTQSGENVNVRKGSTSVDSTEIANIDKGGSFGVAAQGGGYGLSVQGSWQREVGTRGHIGTEAVNMVTTDASRERREMFGHTTNLSQLYQLLSAYHTGTNRVMFFVNARPHVLQQDLTFVNGPRQIEGIQDFFLVVRRPKRVPRICIRAILETAHLYDETIAVVAPTTPAPAAPPPIVQPLSLPTFDGQEYNRWSIPIPSGLTVDRSQGGGELVRPSHNFFGSEDGVVRATVPAGVTVDFLEYATRAENERRALPQIVVHDDHVDITAGIVGGIGGAAFWRCNLRVHVMRAPSALTPPPSTSQSATLVHLFLTGRQISCCQEGPAAVGSEPYIAFEQQLGSDAANLMSSSKGSGKNAAQAANQLNRVVGTETIRSFQSARRYPPGTVPFKEAHFVLGGLAADVLATGRKLLSTKVTKVPEVRDGWKQTINSKSAALTVREALTSTAPALAAETGLSVWDAHKLRAILLGVVAPETGQASPQAPVITSKADAASQKKKK